MAGRSGRGASSVGMMEGAFFVSRTELLSWVNGLLQLSVTKVEQCASGAVYCQIIDACHPGTISMRKVNWMAKADHEYVPNYKVLQAAFDKNKIERHIDVDKLIRAKYQDNLEFLQFMKCYWEYEGLQGDYDPFPAREGKQLPPWATGGGKENLRPQRARAEARAEARGEARGEAAGAAAGPRPSSKAGRASPGLLPGAPARPERAAGSMAAEASARAAAQEEEIEQLRGTVEGLEHERNYYFRKLREVEILCASLQARMEETETLPDLTHKRIVEDIQEILYAEHDGAPIDAEGEAP